MPTKDNLPVKPDKFDINVSARPKSGSFISGGYTDGSLDPCHVCQSPEAIGEAMCNEHRQNHEIPKIMPGTVWKCECGQTYILRIRKGILPHTLFANWITINIIDEPTQMRGRQRRKYNRHIKLIESYRKVIDGDYW